ncbi:MAG: DUF3288 family protein [Hormoscilla sp.]
MTNTSLADRSQQHPQATGDRQILNPLLDVEKPSDLQLAELARLRIRYHGFPGARDIQTDLERVLQKWKLTEEELFERTRQLHAQRAVYKQEGTQQEDFS